MIIMLYNHTGNPDFDGGDEKRVQELKSIFEKRFADQGIIQQQLLKDLVTKLQSYGVKPQDFTCRNKYFLVIRDMYCIYAKQISRSNQSNWEWYGLTYDNEIERTIQEQGEKSIALKSKREAISHYMSAVRKSLEKGGGGGVSGGGKGGKSGKGEGGGSRKKKESKQKYYLYMLIFAEKIKVSIFTPCTLLNYNM